LLDYVDSPCITHRDFRPGNIIVNEGRVHGIIDWSSARGSFAEEDLCTLELGDWTNHPEIKKSFLNGYASIRHIPNYLNVMPLLLLSKTVATIGFTVNTGTWDNKNVNLYQRSRKILESLLEKN
jgi:Ser/Thr protein kinase RdoA (MazF antagonist)